MIAGPYENKGSDERLAAYKKTLKSHGIVIDEKRIIHTATFERGYPEYAKKLLDLNPDLDAIVCASDNLAFDAYQVLKERGIRIGEDVQVVGFDDVQEASKVNPPLATIRAEAAQLGFYAVMDGVLSLRGEIPAEFTTLVDVDFIKPDSAAKGLFRRTIISSNS
ncbi:MAG: substrate-binding domain-containing protein [Thomasclavelia ramosa]